MSEEQASLPPAGGDVSEPVAKPQKEAPPSFHTGLRQAALKLVYWDNVVQSALVLTGGVIFFVVTHVFEYPFLSLVAWMLLVLIGLSLLAKLLSSISVHLGYPVHPALARLQVGTPIPFLEENVAIERAKELAGAVNELAAHWNNILSLEDKKLTGKVVVSLFVIARFFQLVSIGTLLFTTFFLLLTGPKIYELNKKEIDAAVKQGLDIAKEKYAEHSAVAKVKLSELRVHAAKATGQAISKLPPNVLAKVRAYLPADVVAELPSETPAETPAATTEPKTEKVE